VQVDSRRIRTLRSGTPGQGPVVYWMSREQRIQDNWALVYAQERAVSASRGLVVLFCLQPEFLEATWRQYHFMLQGLQEVSRRCRELGISFVLGLGPASETVVQMAGTWDVESVVCDFDPLRIKVQWRQEMVSGVEAPVYMVDAHNIVPCWEASDKQEYAARTIRPKIQGKLFDFLTSFPQLAYHPYPVPGLRDQEPDWENLPSRLRVDKEVGPVDWVLPGTWAAEQVVDDFLVHRLPGYAAQSNDPNAGVLSRLSPYLHFGQIAPQRVALQVRDHKGVSLESKDAYLEQLIVRRELADNFCWYNANYDCYAGLPEWAQKTLSAHRNDPRPYVYTRQELEAAATHDDLWNAAQTQMVAEGKMHGYMRMYWAKKILEWTQSPEQALSIALLLNDRYELDGRDPNGYVGVLWSVGGLHDHGFKARPVFGTVRFMSYAGCKRKFDVQAFIREYSQARMRAEDG